MNMKIMISLLITLMTVNVEGLIMGDLGQGWHYLIKDLRLQDVQPQSRRAPEPTRTPRQIIGSR